MVERLSMQNQCSVQRILLKFKEYLNGHRFERRKMTTKCELFVAPLTSIGIYVMYRYTFA